MECRQTLRDKYLQMSKMYEEGTAFDKTMKNERELINLGNELQYDGIYEENSVATISCSLSLGYYCCCCCCLSLGALICWRTLYPWELICSSLSLIYLKLWLSWDASSLLVIVRWFMSSKRVSNSVSRLSNLAFMWVWSASKRVRTRERFEPGLGEGWSTCGMRVLALTALRSLIRV